MDNVLNFVEPIMVLCRQKLFAHDFELDTDRPPKKEPVKPFQVTWTPWRPLLLEERQKLFISSFLLEERNKQTIKTVEEISEKNAEPASDKLPSAEEINEEDVENSQQTLEIEDRLLTDDEIIELMVEYRRLKNIGFSAEAATHGAAKLLKKSK